MLLFTAENRLESIFLLMLNCAFWVEFREAMMFRFWELLISIIWYENELIELFRDSVLCQLYNTINTLSFINF